MPNMNERLIYAQANGVAAVVVPGDPDMTWEQIAETAVPEGATYDIVNVSDLPTDRVFRNAWERSGGRVEIGLAKAKEVAHGFRRLAREFEMKPYDEIIAKQIPGQNAQQAEAARAALRTKYDALQNQIDASNTVAVLRSHIEPYLEMARNQALGVSE